MKNIIVNELSSSVKSGDKSRIHTLRLIIAAIKDKEIASRSNGENEEISDEVVINLLKKWSNKETIPLRCLKKPIDKN